MNRIGQQMLVGLMVMVFIFIVAIIIIEPLKDVIQEERANLNCSTTNVTNTRALCVVMDLYLPYFIAVLLIGSASYLFWRSVTGGGL